MRCNICLFKVVSWFTNVPHSSNKMAKHITALLVVSISVICSSYNTIHQYTLSDFETTRKILRQETKFDPKILPLLKAKDIFGFNASTSVNLNSLLENFRSLKCIFLLTNYRNIDILPYSYPIVQRRPQVAILRGSGTWTYYMYDARLLWTPYGYLKKFFGNKISNETFYINCSNISQKFIGLNLHNSYVKPQEFCLRINLETFASHSKSWNCQVDLHLTPPSIIMRTMHYPQAFEIPVLGNQWNPKGQFPSNRLHANVVLTSESLKDEDIADWALQCKNSHFIEFAGSASKHEEFLVYTFEGSQKSRIEMVEFKYTDHKHKMHIRRTGFSLLNIKAFPKDEHLMHWKLISPKVNPIKCFVTICHSF